MKMAKVIKFPKKHISMDTFTVDPAYEKAVQNMEKRFGVPLFQYLGIEGDPEETSKIVRRNLQKERLQILTKYMNDTDEEDTTN